MDARISVRIMGSSLVEIEDIEIEIDRLHGCTELLLEDLCRLARVHLIR